MVFSSLFFLFTFLPVFLIVYYATPKNQKNFIALLGSYFFYSWGEPIFVMWLFAGSALDYYISLIFSKVSKPIQKRLLFLSISLNLLILFYCKYISFVLLQFVGFNPDIAYIESSISVAMPIGISFFTFQKISYLVDVYRRRANACRSFIDYALYVSLFPQLIAGPIVRYHDIAEQLKSRVHSYDKFFQGLWRFCIGLFKKVIIANTAAQVADLAFYEHADDSLMMIYAWFGVLAYTVQIYFDFSGYSDMAIGLGKMMGFKFLENFNQPYIANSITDFWNRWHISLSNWMKEYLYIPLGGNKRGHNRTYFNLWVVFLLSGLWHGASWTFVLWGAWHGSWLMLDKILSKHYANIPNNTNPIIDAFLKRFSTFIIVVFGWVLFRASSLDQTGDIWLSMLSIDGLYSYPINSKQIFMVFWGISLALVRWPSQEFYNLVEEKNKYVIVFQMILIVVILIWVTSTLSAEKFNPFIYFRF